MAKSCHELCPFAIVSTRGSIWGKSHAASSTMGQRRYNSRLARPGMSPGMTPTRVFVLLFRAHRGGMCAGDAQINPTSCTNRKMQAYIDNKYAYLINTRFRRCIMRVERYSTYRRLFIFNLRKHTGIQNTMIILFHFYYFPIIFRGIKFRIDDIVPIF